MRKLILLLSAACLIITAVMVHLARRGVSLRAAPIIRSSLMTSDQRHVAEAVILRLFPDLQFAEYLVIGLDPRSLPSQELLGFLKDSYEKQFQRTVRILADGVSATAGDFRDCKTPCWILTPLDQSNELRQKPLVAKFFGDSPARPYVNMTLIPFQRGVEVSEECLQEQRLSLPCLIPLSIHDEERRMKDPRGRYFFVRKYNEKDYFIFTQEPEPEN